MLKVKMKYSFPDGMVVSYIDPLTGNEYCGALLSVKPIDNPTTGHIAGDSNGHFRSNLPENHIQTSTKNFSKKSNSALNCSSFGVESREVKRIPPIPEGSYGRTTILCDQLPSMRGGDNYLHDIDDFYEDYSNTRKYREAKMSANAKITDNVQHDMEIVRLEKRQRADKKIYTLDRELVKRPAIQPKPDDVEKYLKSKLKNFKIIIPRLNTCMTGSSNSSDIIIIDDESNPSPSPSLSLGSVGSSDVMYELSSASSSSSSIAPSSIIEDVNIIDFADVDDELGEAISPLSRGKPIIPLRKVSLDLTH